MSKTTIYIYIGRFPLQDLERVHGILNIVFMVFPIYIYIYVGRFPVQDLERVHGMLNIVFMMFCTYIYTHILVGFLNRT